MTDSQETAIPDDRTRMATILVEYHCNLRCRMCEFHAPESPRPPIHFRITLADHIRVIDRMKECGLRHAHLCALGEVFINRAAFEMIDYTVKNISFVSTQTNFCNPVINQRENIERLVDSGVGIVHTSWDSGDPAQNEYIRRRSSFVQFQNNLEYFFNYKAKNNSPVNLTAWCIMMRCNYMHLAALLERAASIGLQRIDLSILVPFGESGFCSTENVISPADTEIIASILAAVEKGRQLGIDIRVPPIFQPGYVQKQCLSCAALGYTAAINIPTPSLPKEKWLGNISFFCGLSNTRYADTVGNIFDDDYSKMRSLPKVRELARRFADGDRVPRYCQEVCTCYYNPGAVVDPLSDTLNLEWFKF